MIFGQFADLLKHFLSSAASIAAQVLLCTGKLLSGSDTPPTATGPVIEFMDGQRGQSSDVTGRVGQEPGTQRRFEFALGAFDAAVVGRVVRR
jgi:hypothetical protein